MKPGETAEILWWRVASAGNHSSFQAHSLGLQSQFANLFSDNRIEFGGYRKHRPAGLATESTTFPSVFCGGAGGRVGHEDRHATLSQSAGKQTLEKSDGFFGRHRRRVF